MFLCSKNARVVLSITVSLFLVTSSFCYGQENSPDSTGDITGRIVDKTTLKPLPGTTVNVIGSDNKTSADQNGDYVLKGLTPGIYALEFRRVGYEPDTVGNVTVAGNDVSRIDLAMRERAVKVSDIFVQSNTSYFLEGSPASHQSLTREDLASRPKIGEDIYRAVTRMAGVSSNDFSARFRVRGGEHNQVLVLLDGYELIEPFHLKEVDGGAISAIDMEAVGGLDLSAGGYPAQYGEYMSGIFNIRLKQKPQAGHNISAGVDFLSARALGEGLFDDGKGAWLLSARRGYFDLVTKLSDEYDDISPQYYDLLTRLQYDINDRYALSVYLFHAYDKLDFYNDDGEKLRANSEYKNSSTWLNLKSRLLENWQVQNIVAYNTSVQYKSGDGYYKENNEFMYNITDDRKYDAYTLKQDHRFYLNGYFTLLTGLRLKYLDMDYEYEGISENRYSDEYDNYWYLTEVISTKKNLTGHTFNAYVTNRLKLTSFLTTELGIRYDYISYSDDKLYSPRINIQLAPLQNTSLNMSWGYFYQPQKIYDLDIPDNDTIFYPAEKAEHWIVGFNHKFNETIKLKIEGYIKNISNPKPDYRNWLNFIYLFPEAWYDRITLFLDNVTYRGIDVTLNNSTYNKFTWNISYSLSSVKEDVKSYIFDGREIPVNEVLPGIYDQRHTVYVDIGYELPSSWFANLSWEFHSGWPYTEKSINDFYSYMYFYEIGTLMAGRYPDYHRMDLRINKLFRTSKGDFRFFLEIINLYNRDNIYGYEYVKKYDSLGHPYHKIKSHYYLQIMPSLGITWNYEF